VRRRPLLAFFALCFGLTWGLGALFFLFPERIVARFGPPRLGHPLFTLAVFAPSLAALVVTARTQGWAGVRALVARLLRWRVAPGWYLTALFGVPALVALACLVESLARGGAPSLGAGRWWLLYPGLLAHAAVDPGPLGEELGWRGFALPRLVRRWSPLTASLALGAVWGVWHLPAFFVSGLPQAELALPAFLLATLALSVVISWATLRSGSVLIAALVHLTWNYAMTASGASQAVAAAVLVGAALGLVAARPGDWLGRG
jgi:membrane protease YdiL (CAAX protease family)